MKHKLIIIGLLGVVLLLVGCELEKKSKDIKWVIINKDESGKITRFSACVKENLDECMANYNEFEIYHDSYNITAHKINAPEDFKKLYEEMR